MPAVHEAFHLAGRLSKFHLGDVLQLLAMSHLTGRLDLRRPDPLAQGRLYVRDGVLLDADLVEAEAGDACGLPALERILTWKEGHFSFVQDVLPPQSRLNQPITSVLLDTHHRSDLRREFLAALPAGTEVLRIAPEPAIVPILTAEEWRALALVNGRRTLSRITEKCPDDVAILRALCTLIQKGAITTTTLEPERSWQALLPIPVSTRAIQGERPFPARLRANLILKEVDGHKTLGELNQRLSLPVPDLLEDVQYLRDLRWVRFSSGDTRRLDALRTEMAG
jgi:hypothetical protein